MKSFAPIYRSIIEQKGGFNNFIESKDKRSSGALVRRMVKHIPSRSRILEVGAGTAAISVLLARKGFDVTALDSDSEIVSIARDCFRQCHVSGNIIEGSVSSLSKIFAPRKFDYSISHGLMEHYSNNEIYKLLEQQFHVASKVIFIVPMSPMNEKYRNRGIGNERYLTTDAWKKILSQGGYVVNDVYGFGFKETKNSPIFEKLCWHDVTARLMAPYTAFNEFWISK